MSLYSLVSEAFDGLGMVRVPHALERLCVSVGCHLFNMSNLADKRFYNGGNLENFRLSIVFMAPSGYSKSKHFGFFLHPHSGVLSKSGLETTVRGTFSTEAWMGTILKDQELTDGLLAKYRQGIVGADEFMRLINMMNGTGVENDEVYLMKALDTEALTKDLSYGSIEMGDIGMTLWAGLRPSILGLKSGLARRFSFQIFLPTIADSIAFKRATRSPKMQNKLTDDLKGHIREEVAAILQKASTVESLDFSQVYEWLDKEVYTPHFEESLFKRMALGWAVATDTIPEMKVDEKLEALLRDEVKARDIIRSNPEHEAVKRILRSVNEPMPIDDLSRFLQQHYQLHKIQTDYLLGELLDKEVIYWAEGERRVALSSRPL